VRDVKALPEFDAEQPGDASKKAPKS